jgi:large subunit ribosomal protein L25
MDRQILKAQTREASGKKVRKLRREGFIPANVYGKKIKSHSIQITKDDFKKVHAIAGETGLVDLVIGDSKNPVLISFVQIHPVTDLVLHVDFRQVDLKEKVVATVPVEIVGESPAEKSGLGTVVHLVNELEVEALPTDLIEKFEVDVTTLTEVDQAIKVSDLKYDTTKLEVKNDIDTILVKVEPPQKEEEVQAPVVASEVPAEGEAQPEAPAQSEAAETSEE